MVSDTICEKVWYLERCAMLATVDTNVAEEGQKVPRRERLDD